MRFWYQRYKKKYFILFKKSTGIDGEFKVVIVEKEGNICAPPSMNPITSHHWYLPTYIIVL